MHARNLGAMHLIMTYMPENDPLKQLAERAGMHLIRDTEEPRAYLSLDPPNALSLMDETFSEMLARSILALESQMPMQRSGDSTSA